MSIVNVDTCVPEMLTSTTTLTSLTVMQRQAREEFITDIVLRERVLIWLMSLQPSGMTIMMKLMINDNLDFIVRLLAWNVNI